jgi:hypothetical protein
LQACCPPPEAVTPTLCWTTHRPTIIRAIAGEPGCHLSGRVLRRCVQCPHVDVRELPLEWPGAERRAPACSVPRQRSAESAVDDDPHVAEGVTQ